jgi:hypothetical protein
MEDPDRANEFISSGLAALGIGADEVDFAVMAAAHEVYWPAICDLLSLDTSDIEMERYPDLSRAP